MSRPPNYSETFFNNKIKGLQLCGYTVTLFVQTKDTSFTLCDTQAAPKVYPKYILLQVVEGFKVFIKLIAYPKRINRFVKLERSANRPWKQILKNLYNNSHILTSTLDWLHFGFATMALQSEHVAKAIGSKMAVSCRGYDMDVYPLKHDKVYNLLWTHVDKVHAISNYMLQRAYANGMLSTTPFTIITPAVNTSSLKILKPRLKTTTLHIVTIARLHWIKGLTETLEALAKVKQKGIAFTYTLIGDGAEFQNLKFAVHQLGLSDVVVFTGKLAHEDVIDLLSTSDLYIQYSHSEGFCNAVLEAQAIGCLCVVSDGGALSENIIHGQTGWVVPKRQPQKLAETLLKVIHLPLDENLKIRSMAQERVKAQFSLEKQQQEFIEFYKS